MKVKFYSYLSNIFISLFFVLFFAVIGLAKNPYFLNKKGLKSFYNGKYASSLKYFNDAFDTDKRDEYKFNKGVSLYKLKKYDNSSSIFLSLLNKSDNQALKEKAFYNLGVISYKKKNLKQALEFFKNALEIDDKDKAAKINYEIVLKQLEKEKRKKSEKNQSENKKNKQNKNNNKTGQNQKKNLKRKNGSHNDKQKKELKNKNKIDKKILNLYSDDKKLIKKSIKKLLGVKRENPEKDW